MPLRSVHRSVITRRSVRRQWAGLTGMMSLQLLLCLLLPLHSQATPQLHLRRGTFPIPLNAQGWGDGGGEWSESTYTRSEVQHSLSPKLMRSLSRSISALNFARTRPDQLQQYFVHVPSADSQTLAEISAVKGVSAVHFVPESSFHVVMTAAAAAALSTWRQVLWMAPVKAEHKFTDHLWDHPLDVLLRRKNEQDAYTDIDVSPNNKGTPN